MHTTDSVRAAILEILDGSEDLTEQEIYRALREEQSATIPQGTMTRALASLLADRSVTELVSRDPHGALDGNPSLFFRTSNQMRG